MPSVMNFKAYLSGDYDKAVRSASSCDCNGVMVAIEKCSISSQLGSSCGFSVSILPFSREMQKSGMMKSSVIKLFSKIQRESGEANDFVVIEDGVTSFFSDK